MKKYIFSLLVILSIQAPAATKQTVEEAKKNLLSVIAGGTDCRHQIQNLHNQSTCQTLRETLAQCSISAVNERGESTDVANVVQCRE